MFNLARADRATRRAAELLGRRLPTAYPPNAPEESAGERRAREFKLYGRGQPPTEEEKSARSDGTLRELVATGAAELLAAAVRTERDAAEAKVAAIEALRHTYPHRYPWERIGELVGMTGAGAHKRYRSVEDPEPQLELAEGTP